MEKGRWAKYSGFGRCIFAKPSRFCLDKRTGKNDYKKEGPVRLWEGTHFF
jgi:hypothetical protein